MQSKTILGVVLALGLAFALISGSGMGGAVFGESADSETTRTIDEVSQDAQVDGEGEGLSANVGGDNEPTLVGVAISGGRFAAQLVGSVALLPVTLMRLGFPAYFAVPVGGVAQIIAFIGLVQFIRGTEYI